jgi:hypothetical protein
MDGLALLLVVGALASLFWGPWQHLSIDTARQELFRQRARLLYVALEGRISFNDESYRETRRTINSLIRNAHELTLPRILLLYFFPRKNTHQPRLRQVVSAIDDAQVKDEVEHILFSCAVEVIHMILYRNILTFPVVVVLKLIHLNHARWVRRLVARKAELLFTDAARAERFTMVENQAA